MISGEVKAGVPQNSYRRVSRGLVMPARPKSATLTRRFASIRMFSGFKSLWMTCLRPGLGVSSAPWCSAGGVLHDALHHLWVRISGSMPQSHMCSKLNTIAAPGAGDACGIQRAGGSSAPSVAVVDSVHHLQHHLLCLALQQPRAALHRQPPQQAPAGTRLPCQLVACTRLLA